MTDDTTLNANGAGAVPPIPSKDVVGAASDILSKQEGGAEVKHEGDVHVETPTAPMSFDINALTPDQLQQLKERLDITPQRALRPMGKPTVRLRNLNGNFVIDIGNAFNTWIHDDQANQNVEMVMIPVTFLGETTPINVPYKEFMGAPQIDCEVIARQSVPHPETDGAPIMSRVNGMLVERTVMRMDETFTIKLPAGTSPETITVKGRIVNA